MEFIFRGRTRYVDKFKTSTWVIQVARLPKFDQIVTLFYNVIQWYIMSYNVTLQCIMSLCSV